MAYDPTEQNLVGLVPELRERATALIYICRYYGLPAIITAGRRSYIEQARLYAQGRITPGPIVTNSLVGTHNSGRAFDVGFPGVTPDEVPAEVWTFVGFVGEYLGLVWGGRWRGIVDKPHFELPAELLPPVTL